MKNAYKKIINLFLTLIIIFSSVICLLETLGNTLPSVSLSFSLSLPRSSNAGLKQVSDINSLFFIDVNLVNIDNNYVYVYDNKDSCIKIIDRKTNTFKEINNHYKFSNLKDMVIFDNSLLLLNGETNTFTALTIDSLNEVEFSSQENLTTIGTAKTVKIVKNQNKNYILLCPLDPTSSNFEIAEIRLEKKPISGTEYIDSITLSNIKTFKISESWSTNNILNSYDKIYTSIINDELFIMMLTENELYSFNVDLENILSIPYSIITSVSGLDNSENIIDFSNINLKNQKNNILIAYENSICFYNLNIIENVSVNLEKLNYEITLNNFNVTKINSCDTSFAVISNSKQAAKIYNLENSFNDGFSEKEVKNEEITPHFYSSSMFKYVKTTQETELIDSPYSKNSTINIPGQTNLVIVGEGQYLDNTPIIGWEYVMFTNNGQNYYGYVDSLSLTNLESSSYSKNYVTCLAHTKLYSLPSIFLDSINKELKSIIGSSRLEIIDTICDYSSQNVSYVLVKVNGETIGFIDKSRIIKTTGVNEKIIPNATIMRNNSEIFTSTTNDKEIIIRLNKGDRVKVIGKRDTVTNYTKVSFNDSEGNEYTGYVYTHNLEPDSWSMLQIIGMLLVVLNVILLIIIICIKNKVTR